MNHTDFTLAYYNHMAEDFTGRTRNIEFSFLQNQFASYVRPGGRILDLGCGSGRDSKAFLDMGYQVTAIDGSRELCRLASAYLGQEVICTTFQDYQPEGRFDGIWACASLLHLSVDEVKKTISKYVAALEDQGVFYVSFKYGTFSGERSGRYFTDMNEELLSEVLADIPALRIDQQFITDSAKPGREDEKWLNVFLTKSLE